MNIKINAMQLETTIFMPHWSIACLHIYIYIYIYIQWVAVRNNCIKSLLNDRYFKSNFTCLPGNADNMGELLHIITRLMVRLMHHERKTHTKHVACHTIPLCIIC